LHSVQVSLNSTPPHVDMHVRTPRATKPSRKGWYNTAVGESQSR
jgi:hypothetical protein